MTITALAFVHATEVANAEICLTRIICFILVHYCVHDIYL